MTIFCPQCGAELKETQRFCNKCGAQVQPTQPAAPPPQTYAPPGQPTGPTAPYGQPPYQQPYGPPGYNNAAPGAAGLQSNVAAALAYLFVPAIIFLVLEPYSRDRFVRFHSWQAIFFFVALFILQIVVLVAYAILPWPLDWLISLAFRIGSLVGWIWLMYEAYSNRLTKLPVIGDIAEQQTR
jgi:uncharacterized membrane protein